MARTRTSILVEYRQFSGCCLSGAAGTDVSRCARKTIWTSGWMLIVLIANCGVLLLRSPISAAAADACETDAPAPAWIARTLDFFLPQCRRAC
jgi:hypothetical protein